MQHFVDATRKALEDLNWFAALSLALTLPDICGRLSDPRAGTRGAMHSKARYIAWCDTYLVPKYTANLPRPDGAGVRMSPHVFLSAQDTYALRCAVLHEGSDSILDQAARQVLSRFRFVAQADGTPAGHCNQINQSLTLDVGEFCRDVCQAVEEWIADTHGDPQVGIKTLRLMQVEVVEGGVTWTADQIRGTYGDAPPPTSRPPRPAPGRTPRERDANDPWQLDPGVVSEAVWRARAQRIFESRDDEPPPT